MSPVQGSSEIQKITPALKQKIINAVMKEAGPRSVEQLAQEENELLDGLPPFA
jgi:hypothetical protein